jgi:hypothetical protein
MRYRTKRSALCGRIPRMSYQPRTFGTKWNDVLNELGRLTPAAKRVKKSIRNVRDRLVTLLSASPPLAPQRGYLVHTLGS